MDTKQPEHARDEPKQSWLWDAVESALRDMPSAEEASKNERRLLAGSALGVCLAIMLAMLSLPRLDQPLHIALIALAVAAPLLILDFFYAPARPKPGRYYPLKLAMWLAADIIGDGLGILAVVVGIGAVLWHLYTTAVLVLIGSCVGSIVVLLCLALAILIFLQWRKLRADKKTAKPLSGD